MLPALNSYKQAHGGWSRHRLTAAGEASRESEKMSKARIIKVADVKKIERGSEKTTPCRQPPIRPPNCSSEVKAEGLPPDLPEALRPNRYRELQGDRPPGCFSRLVIVPVGRAREFRHSLTSHMRKPT